MVIRRGSQPQAASYYRCNYKNISKSEKTLVPVISDPGFSTCIVNEFTSVDISSLSAVCLQSWPMFLFLDPHNTRK